MKTELSVFSSGISIKLLPETFEEIQGLIALAMNANRYAREVFSMRVTNNEMCATICLNRRRDRLASTTRDVVYIQSK